MSIDNLYTQFILAAIATMLLMPVLVSAMATLVTMAVFAAGCAAFVVGLRLGLHTDAYDMQYAPELITARIGRGYQRLNLRVSVIG